MTDGEHLVDAIGDTGVEPIRLTTDDDGDGCRITCAVRGMGQGPNARQHPARKQEKR